MTSIDPGAILLANVKAGVQAEPALKRAEPRPNEGDGLGQDDGRNDFGFALNSAAGVSGPADRIPETARRDAGMPAVLGKLAEGSGGEQVELRIDDTPARQAAESLKGSDEGASPGLPADEVIQTGAKPAPGSVRLSSAGSAASTSSTGTIDGRILAGSQGADSRHAAGNPGSPDQAPADQSAMAGTAGPGQAGSHGGVETGWGARTVPTQTAAAPAHGAGVAGESSARVSDAQASGQVVRNPGTTSANGSGSSTSDHASGNPQGQAAQAGTGGASGSHAIGRPAVMHGSPLQPIVDFTQNQSPSGGKIGSPTDARGVGSIPGSEVPGHRPEAAPAGSPAEGQAVHAGASSISVGQGDRQALPDSAAEPLSGRSGQIVQAPAQPAAQTSGPLSQSGPDQAAAARTLYVTEMPVFLPHTLRAAVRDGVREAKIRLWPPELGAIRVQLQVNGEMVTARIQAERPDAHALLERMRGALQKGMQQSGLTLQRLEIELGGSSAVRAASSSGADQFDRDFGPSQRDSMGPGQGSRDGGTSSFSSESRRQGDTREGPDAGMSPTSPAAGGGSRGGCPAGSKAGRADGVDAWA